MSRADENVDNTDASLESDRAHPLETGARIGDSYVVDSYESRDGASFRYLVRDTGLGNLCRARVFVAPWCKKAEVRSALKQCALQQSRIPHSGVLSVRDVFEDDPEPLTIVSDYIDGPTLADHLRNVGRLSEHDAVSAIRQLLSALTAAHRKALHHLGLSSSCVWLQLDDTEQVTTVVDGFGIAQSVPGDEAYWAPEQHAGTPANERTDVYACGLLFYEMLVGELPPSGDLELREKLPTLSLRIERVLTNALTPDPDERFANADAMRTAMGSDSLILPAVQTSNSQIRVPEEIVRRAGGSTFRWLWITATVVGVAASATLAWYLSADMDAEEESAGPSATGIASSLLTTEAEETPLHQAPPAPTDTTPVPLDGLPGATMETALVDLVITTALDNPFTSPAALDHLDALKLRYGNNLRSAWVVVTDTDTNARARAALAAHLQDRFDDFAAALLRHPTALELDAFAVIADDLALDVARFRADFDSEHVSTLLDHHAAIAQRLGTSRSGDAFINGKRVTWGANQPHLISEDILIAAVDAELDAVQSELAVGAAPEKVAKQRTIEALKSQTVGSDLEQFLLGAYDAPRLDLPVEGHPALGAANAPLRLVLFADLAQPVHRDVLDVLRTYQMRHPESVSVVVELAPAPDHQAGFDLAIELLAAHARGEFWTSFADLADPPVELAPSVIPLLRARAVEQSERARSLDPTASALVYANGRQLNAADQERLRLELDEERLLVEQLVQSGIAPNEVQRLVSAAADPLPPIAEPNAGRFLIANWHAQPRLGPVDASVVVFWRMSPEEPDWQRTLVGLARLHAELPDDVAIAITPAAQSKEDPVLRLFQRWWGMVDDELYVELLAFENIASKVPPLPTQSAAARVAVVQYLQRAEPIPDTDGSADAVSGAAFQWSPESAPHGSVVVAWRRGLRFSGWTLPGGQAFEIYWDAVQRAKRQ